MRSTDRPSLFSALVIAAGLAGLLFSAPPMSAEPTRHHALSLVGEPQYGPGFKHFDWVNPEAPKGGTVRRFALGAFDSFNAFSIKGESADRLGLIYDSLMADSPDEPSTQYCHICEWVSYPDDFSSVTFGLRASAKFNDGKQITPEDVIFSLAALKKANPQYAFYYKNVVKAEKTGEREVTFTFDKTGNRELPVIVGQLSILPKHWWEGENAKGEKRDITKTFLEPPLGSGPYQLKSFVPGRSIIYGRVADWWAKDLAVSKGQWNFDEIRIEYFRDQNAGFENFKSGGIDFWNESSARNWATRYAFKAAKDGRVNKEALPQGRVAGMQAFAFNTRRKQFSDPRVRRAFNDVFNFERANKTIFYGAYTRLASFFDNSELAAKGLPKGRELEILTEIKDEVPPEVFTTEFKNPLAADLASHRNNMREAFKRLQAAGWKQQNRTLKNAEGKTLDAEFLLVQANFKPIVLPFVEDLKKLGINATVRVVDTSQYIRRLENFDYDIIVSSWGQSHSPGNEQRNFWGTATADRAGSRNFIGIKNPAIDKLIDKIVFAKDREDLIASTRALDRVLLWNHYVVPQWYLPKDRLAYWNKFGRPSKLPSQNPAGSLLQTWWIDTEKEQSLQASRSR